MAQPTESNPVVIPIDCPSVDEAPPPEWAMIELNGELIPPTELTPQQEGQVILGGKDRVELGRLKLGDDPKTPVLIVGSHQLKGKTEDLKEPFCVMRKQYDDEGQLQQYQVVGVIKRKLMFNQYPKVIMR